jgi:putative addiction module CopG family antidote
MNITLPAELEAYIEQRVRSGAFASESDVVEVSILRQMQEEAWLEAGVVEGLAAPVTPLTQQDLTAVRDIVRKVRASQSA